MPLHMWEASTETELQSVAQAVLDTPVTADSGQKGVRQRHVPGLQRGP